LFEAIRREYEFGIGTIKGVARKLGVHRRMVREALRSAVPVQKPPPERPRPRLGPVVDFIDGILEADRKAPRKQRHTAHRIYVRISKEHPEAQVAESTVRKYVRKRKRALGLDARGTFVPQSYAWGDEAQVDWYEAEADLGGERQKLQVFVLRSMASGGSFHRAYYRPTQQAFLEAHQLGFHYFGGVFRRLRYDNLPLAVKKILRGYQREETSRFIAFRSHWRFQSEFCTPAEAHEKGGAENEVGTFRRNHWVPVPKAGDLAELNAQLLEGCRQDEGRVIAGHDQTVGSAMLIEREHLLPLAEEDFDITEVAFPTVNGIGCVKVRTNAYSVPVRSGAVVQARIAPTAVEVWYEGRCVASHERCYGRHQEIFNLEHYLDVLERKPGAFPGSKPLAQWRERGLWPQSYDRFWQGLMERHGRQKGTRAMIELLQLGRTYGQEKLRWAVEEALALGCGDSAAVRYLLTAHQLERVTPAPLSVGVLAAFERPLPAVTDYDQLLVGGPAR
ncbi:MAG: IS21 family transposase, partial [Chloroflexi bacterium]|nr:IS21 family transposase [Chloroflexota bacterium]